MPDAPPTDQQRLEQLIAADADSALDAAVASSSRQRLERIIRAAAIPVEHTSE